MEKKRIYQERMRKVINNKYFIDLITLRSEMEFRGYSKSTQKTYTRIVEEFLNFADKEIIYIRREDVINFLDKKLEILSPNTVLVELNALEFFFEEILGLSITENIRKYKRIFKKKDFISLSEFNKLMGSVPERERLVYWLIKELGMFSKEIVALRSNDISYIKSSIKGRKVSKELVKALLEYSDKNYSEIIFDIGSATLRYWNRKNTLKVLGKAYSFSDLIHSLALELYIKQGNEKKAAKYLGNISIASVRQFYKRSGYSYLEG